MIEYRTSIDTVQPEQLHGFFVGWPNPPAPEKLLTILRNALHRIVAFDTSSNCVVGFVYAVGDGILSAYVPLLEVLPNYQHRGIGSELMRRILNDLQAYYMVDLCCNTELVEFYKQLGMIPVAGMVKRNYSRQSGE